MPISGCKRDLAPLSDSWRKRELLCFLPSTTRKLYLVTISTKTKLAVYATYLLLPTFVVWGAFFYCCWLRVQQNVLFEGKVFFSPLSDRRRKNMNMRLSFFVPSPQSTTGCLKLGESCKSKRLKVVLFSRGYFKVL